jgi:predicted transcriptional regulator
MSGKQIVFEVLSNLPDDCTLDEIRYRLFVRAKIERGIAAIETGPTYTPEEAKSQVRTWLASSGPTPC